jgi:hypothetical protein
MPDAKTWLFTFRTIAVIFGLGAALATAVALILDKSVQRGRRLTPSQIASLTTKLRAVAKLEFPITLGSPDGDDEAKDVAVAIKQSLTAASFAVDGVWRGPLIGSDPIGVLVRQKPKDAAIGVQAAAALGTVGLTSNLVEYGEPGHLDIYVGRKP